MDSAEVMRSLLEATIASSLASLLVLSLRKATRAAFGARVAYALWAIVPVAAVAVLLPAMQMSSQPPVLAFVQSVAPVASAKVAAMQNIDYARWLVIAWMAGVAFTTLWFLWQQRDFVRGLGRIFIRDDGLHQAQSIAGLPAAIGLWKPRVVVPSDFDQRYTEDEQQLLREHERAHIRHGDLQCNAIAALLRCVFWFNPLLHFAARHFRHDQELACDQRVVARHPHARRRYGEAMLKTQLAAHPLPVGCHWGFSHPLKERIAMLKAPVPTMKRRLAGSACLLALTLACGYVAWAAQPATPAAVVPAGSIRAKVALQIDESATTEKTFVVRPGTPITMTQSVNGHVWTLNATAAPGTGEQRGLLMFEASLVKDGKLVGTPKIAMKNGQPGRIEIGTDGSQVGGKFEGIRLEVTLNRAAEAVAAAQRAPASVSVSAHDHEPVQRLDPPTARTSKV